MELHRNEAIRMMAEAELNHLNLEERNNLLISDWWYADEENPEYIHIPEQIRNDIAKNDMPVNAANNIYDPLLIKSLSLKFSGVKNTYLHQRLIDFYDVDADIVGKEESLVKCPCCGYKTLTNRGEYDICRVCFWEDNGQDNPAEYSGCNHITLGEAQQNFMEYGACNKKALGFVDKEGIEKYFRSVKG